MCSICIPGFTCGGEAAATGAASVGDTVCCPPAFAGGGSSAGFGVVGVTSGGVGVGGASAGGDCSATGGVTVCGASGVGALSVGVVGVGAGSACNCDGVASAGGSGAEDAGGLLLSGVEGALSAVGAAPSVGVSPAHARYSHYNSFKVSGASTRWNSELFKVSQACL